LESPIVKCIVQPGDGVAYLVKGIDKAKKSIEIVIFRFNRREIEKALASAVTRGVHVHALIAHTNRGGETNLRQLELRLLGAGVTVARTDDDLVRYHGKLMIVDRRELYLLAFNFTYLDMERSRSFGIVTTNRKHVQEAARLFEADTNRQPYSPASATFVVSPLNARKQLSTFIRGAKKELLIYDPEIGDPAMVRLLEARSKAGVTVNIIGKLAVKNSVLPAPQSLQIRLHTRSILRDGTWAFVGSQSLRALELDSRREVGIIFRDPAVVTRLVKTFRDDWAAGGKSEGREPTPDEVAQTDAASASKMAKKVAKAVVNGLRPVTPVVATTVRELSGMAPEVRLNEQAIEATVKTAVQDAVRQVVRDFVEEAVEAHDATSKNPASKSPASKSAASET
jgi:phosphatidylserine/phosphatidylglycerophosphate/cardiolipin synthase-like enzyme